MFPSPADSAQSANARADVPEVSFMIATRNRADELRKTLLSCLAQTGVAIEILVVDDASVDGTYDIVRQELPGVDVVRWEKNRGSIAARNDILRRARGKYVIALDDDSRLVEPGDCRRVVDRMDAEPDLGIVSFQIIGPEYPERMAEAGRLRGEWHVSSFGANAAAIRRSMLNRIGLFPEYFFHAYEEPDLCLRAWDAGYRVLQWNDIVVYHEFSPLDRDEQRTHRHHARNAVCSVWMRFPAYLVLPVTAVRLASACRYVASRGWLWREPRVWIETLFRLPLALWYRRPVRAEAAKIVVALSRGKIRDSRKVWELGNLSWRQVLKRRHAAIHDVVEVSNNGNAVDPGVPSGHGKR